MFQKEQTQEETGTVTEDMLELKTWNKHTKRTTDDTEVNSQLLVGTHFCHECSIINVLL